MKRITLALLALLGMSCTLWQPYGAMHQDIEVTPSPTQHVFTPAPTSANLQSCTVTAKALNVRTGPGTSYQVIGYLYEGDTVTFRDRSGAWLATDTGWIHGAYCHDLP